MKKRRADYIADAVRQKIDANRQRAEETRERDDREAAAIRDSKKSKINENDA